MRDKNFKKKCLEPASAKKHTSLPASHSTLSRISVECTSSILGSYAPLVPRQFQRSDTSRTLVSLNRTGRVRSARETKINFVVNEMRSKPTNTHLFNARDGNVTFAFPFGTRLGQIVVNATGAEDQFLHIVGIVGGRTVIGNDSQEFGSLGHQIEVALRFRMTQQRLRCAQDQRFAEGQRDLSTQNVEQIGWRCAVGNDPVDVVELADGKFFGFGWEVVGIVGAHLQEAFDATRRMLRSHAFHAVRQQHHQATLTHPFRLAAGDELIDDALGGVGEIAELSLPDDKSIWIGHAVAQFEAEHSWESKRRLSI